ncbi:MAG: hypothetical protein ACRD1M_09640 [Terriglobales bacterium]
MPAKTLTFEDDDLETLPAAPTATPTPARAAAKAQVSALPQAAPAAEVSWGDEDVAQIGDGLLRLKPESGKVIRVALVPGVKPRAAKVHWIEVGKKGNYRCPGANCPLCAGGNDTRYAVAALAVQYTNADAQTGKKPKDTAPEVKVGYLALSQATFRAVSDLAPEGLQPTDIDIAVEFDGRRYGFRAVATTPWWRAAGLDIASLGAPFVANLANKVGRVVPTAQLAVLAKAANAASAIASAKDLDDLDEV